MIESQSASFHGLLKRFTAIGVAAIVLACAMTIPSSSSWRRRASQGPEVNEANVLLRFNDITVLMADRARLTGGIKDFDAEPNSPKRFWMENWTKPEDAFQWTVEAGKQSSCKIDLLISGLQGKQIEIAGPVNKLTCTLERKGWDKLEVPGR